MGRERTAQPLDTDPANAAAANAHLIAAIYTEVRARAPRKFVPRANDDFACSRGRRAR
jgi:hypothetical protein